MRLRLLIVGDAVGQAALTNLLCNLLASQQSHGEHGQLNLDSSQSLRCDTACHCRPGAA